MGVGWKISYHQGTLLPAWEASPGTSLQGLK